MNNITKYIHYINKTILYLLAISIPIVYTYIIVNMARILTVGILDYFIFLFKYFVLGLICVTAANTLHKSNIYAKFYIWLFIITLLFLFPLGTIFSLFLAYDQYYWQQNQKNTTPT